VLCVQLNLNFLTISNVCAPCELEMPGEQRKHKRDKKRQKERNKKRNEGSVLLDETENSKCQSDSFDYDRCQKEQTHNTKQTVSIE